jgi:hypothetical protein
MTLPLNYKKNNFISDTSFPFGNLHWKKGDP